MHASAIAHPNVALIKYWGKRDSVANLPATGSLSLTLSHLETKTSVSFESGLERDEVSINGQPDDRALKRITACLNALRIDAGVEHFARVESHNNFPTGAGLASSASGYAALLKAAHAALGLNWKLERLANVARMGSGSAPRSLYDGIVLLEQDADSISCRSIAAPEAWPLSVLVAVTSRKPKSVGSTDGMELSRRTSPYYAAWLDSHPADIRSALDYIEQQDFSALAELSEHSCLKMHALAMSSQPALFYWSAATVECMHRIWELRRSGVPVFFTIDAGPQLKAICLPEASIKVQAALTDCSGVLEVIESGLGRGAWTL